jgi:hypothetical protein
VEANLSLSFYCLFIYVLCRRFSNVKRGQVGIQLTCFYHNTFFSLSEAKIWISVGLCHGLFVFNDVTWEVVVGLVDIG